MGGLAVRIDPDRLVEPNQRCRVFVAVEVNVSDEQGRAVGRGVEREGFLVGLEGVVKLACREGLLALPHQRLDGGTGRKLGEIAAVGIDGPLHEIEHGIGKTEALRLPNELVAALAEIGAVLAGTLCAGLEIK